MVRQKPQSSGSDKSEVHTPAVRFPTRDEQRRGLTEKPGYEYLPPLKSKNGAAELARSKQVSRLAASRKKKRS